LEGWILYHKSESEIADSDYETLRLIEAAKAKDIKIKVFKPEQFDLVVTRDDRKSILIEGKHQALPDFIIPRLGSDTTYFALAILRQIEHLGVYILNSPEAIESVKDKLHIHQILAHSDLPTPNFMLVKFPVNIEIVKKEIGFPLIVKNLAGTEGCGIYLSETEGRFMDLMELIYSNNKSANILIQEFVKTSHGSDLRVFTLGGRVIACMKRQSSNPSDFKANFSRGGTVDKFELTPEIEWLATETSRLVNLDIAGIDLLFDNEGYKICEANSSPGFRGLELATGKIIAEQIMDYITIRLSGSLK
jgi:gamma-F420-2:alpha-L-glutamate ligase